MSLTLPRVVLDTSGPEPVVVERAPEVSDADLDAILGTHARPSPAWAVERCVPLPDRRWAAGHEHGGRAVWRFVGTTDPDRIGGHAAWLWTAEAWFDPALPVEANARAPAALPLRHLVKLMSPVGGRTRRTIKALAAVVSSVRGGRPTALAVDPELVASASRPARWFALALVAVLPPTLRERLRVSIGAPLPVPGPFDLAIVPPVEGAIDATDPPDEGEDLVAYYVRNRLYDDDPEALEAAAFLFDGDADRWSDKIAGLVRDGLPGVSEVTDGLVDQDPERAVRAIAARLRAGAQLDPTLLRQLVEVTLRTRDARPWRALVRRPALQRADAVDALLAHAHRLRPGPEIVAELAALYPRGAPLETWVPALLGWLEEGSAPAPVVAAIESTLLHWPLSATGATRASVWTEVVRLLVHLGRDEDAMEAMTGDLAREIARDGAGRALVASWTSVPRRFRDPRYMDRLVGILNGVPDGDRAAADLLRLVKADPDEAQALVVAWARRAPGVPADDHALLTAVLDTPLLRTWAETLVDEGAPRQGLSGALGEAVADVLVERAPDARASLLALAELPAPARAVGLAEAAVRAGAFPDADLVAASEAMARAAGASPVWAWLAVAAAPPDLWDEATVDATVVEFGEAPDVDGPAQALALAAAERLGSAHGWEPLDHARWVVRFALAPGTLQPGLLAGLLAGIRAREDGPLFLAAVLDPLLELGPEHDAVRGIVAALPRAGWTGDVLRSALAALEPDRVPEALEALC